MINTEDDPDAEIPYVFAACTCVKKPSPTGPFKRALHDRSNFILASKGADKSGGKIEFKRAPSASAPKYQVEFTNESGQKQTVDPKDAKQVWVYSGNERYWLGCKAGQMHIAPRPGESFDKLLVDGNFYTVHPESRVILKSPEASCEFLDYDYGNQQHVRTPIPATGFEFLNETDIIAVHVTKILASDKR